MKAVGVIRMAVMAGAAGLALAAAPAVAQKSGGPADCDPAVAKALEDSAVRGVERDQVIIRHQDEGIGDPDSIYDLSCDLLNFPSWDALVRLPNLPDLFSVVCDAAREIWRNRVTRPFDRAIYGLDRERGVLPGLDVRPRTRRLPGVDPDVGRVFRGVLGQEEES